MESRGESLDVELPILAEAEHLHIDAQGEGVHLLVEDDALGDLLVVFVRLDYFDISGVFIYRKTCTISYGQRHHACVTARTDCLADL